MCEHPNCQVHGKSRCEGVRCDGSLAPTGSWAEALGSRVDEFEMVERRLVRAGDVVFSSHHGHRAVTAAATHGSGAPGTTELRFGTWVDGAGVEQVVSERYDADLEIPRARSSALDVDVEWPQGGASEGARRSVVEVLGEHPRGDWSDRTYTCQGCAARFEEENDLPAERSLDDLKAWRAAYAKVSHPGWTREDYDRHVAQALADAGCVTDEGPLVRARDLVAQWRESTATGHPNCDYDADCVACAADELEAALTLTWASRASLGRVAAVGDGS